MGDSYQLRFEGDPKRHRLFRTKLGDLLSWQRPVLTKSIGPSDSDAFGPFDAKRMKCVVACADKLASYSDEQIEAIVKPDGADAIWAREWHEFLSDEISALSRKIPAWHAGGFGHPDHAADFSHWTKMPRFDLAELTCLSMGISPSEFPLEKLSSLSISKDRPGFSRPIEFLVKRYEQLLRTFGRLVKEVHVSAREFLDWARRFEVEVHPDFLEPLRRYHAADDTGELPPPAAKQDRREIDSIAKLFTAMAIEQFGYDPGQTRSPATKEIADLATSLGMSITDDTIRKFLRLGAKFISPDWNPHKR